MRPVRAGLGGHGGAVWRAEPYVGALVASAWLALLPPAAARVLVYSYVYESGKSADAEKAYGVDKMDPGGGGTFMFHNVNQHYLLPRRLTRPQSRAVR